LDIRCSAKSQRSKITGYAVIFQVTITLKQNSHLVKFEDKLSMEANMIIKVHVQATMRSPKISPLMKWLNLASTPQN